MEELKPCPFCGGKANLERIDKGYNSVCFTETYVVSCSDCKCNLNKEFKSSIDRSVETGDFMIGIDGRAWAIEEWNKRSNEK